MAPPAGRAPSGPVRLSAAASRVERRRAIARRRARLALVAACGFAAIVLVAGFPLRTLLQQRANVASASSTVQRLARSDAALARQAAALSSAAAIDNLAHSEFDYVKPGQKAYDVVPASSSTNSVAVGHINLKAPVAAPGSAASVASTGIAGSGAATAAGGRSVSTGGATNVGGFWSRLTRSLEFWG